MTGERKKSEDRTQSMFGYSDVRRESDGSVTVGPIRGVPDIRGGDIEEIGAWFIGPRAENEELLRTMIGMAVEEAIAYRKKFSPEDPPVITESLKQSASYQQSVERMLSSYTRLVEFLGSYATPYFSMRYQAHMLWDNSLPALCAYFATMLHNPNNVTIQASSSTTPLEILVGWDLCGMVGFPVSSREREYNPWAHITCDGTVANVEAAWVAREVKYLGVAVRRFLLETRYMEENVNDRVIRVSVNNSLIPILVRGADGREFCLTDKEVDCWQLVNMPADELLRLPGRIAASYGLESSYTVWSAVARFGLNGVGWLGMNRYLRTLSGDCRLPVMIVPSTMHYSWPKSAALLGMGSGPALSHKTGKIEEGRLLTVGVDQDGRMEMAELERSLRFCLDNRIPVALTVGVVGSTEEGAVDPVGEILDLRERFRSEGLDFIVHADAAWGGYMITAMRNPYTLGESVEQAESCPDLPPYEPSLPFVTSSASPFSEYVYDQFSRMCECDSITIDPHKMGYVQYPAGSILYRNGMVRRLTTFSGAYIGGTGSVDPGGEPSVGIFGIEGSKPGAAAAAVFMNHRVIRPDITGHGKIVHRVMENTRLFAHRLLELGRRSEQFEVVLLSTGASEIDRTEQEGPGRDFGPDLNILDYVFNPVLDGNVANKSPAVLNEFNNAVYELFHVPVEQNKARRLPVPIDEFPEYFLTKTTFSRANYGDLFMDGFLTRIFGEGRYRRVDSIVCLRSVVMDPFMPFTSEGDFLKTLIGDIGRGVDGLVSKWRSRAW